MSGAVRTDFILSAEIMVISLNEVADEAFVSRAIILVVVALGITVLVYGVVGLIVKMDDVGLRLSERPGKGVARFGRGLVKAMPKLLTVLTVIGTAAMLWVGGHILLVGTDELGLHVLYERRAPPGGGGARRHRRRSAVSWAGSSTRWPARSSALVVGAPDRAGHEPHGAPAQEAGRRRARGALAGHAAGFRRAAMAGGQ